MRFHLSTALILMIVVALLLGLTIWIKSLPNPPDPKEARSNCMAIIQAQEIYHRLDHDKDGINEYATRVRDLLETQPGLQDLLYVDPALGRADDTRPDCQPKHGYFFKILTGGDSILGGKLTYMKDGNLVLAHALLAYPALNADTERYPSYLISSTGVLYERYLGPDPITQAQSINEYSLDGTWKKFD